MPLEEFARHPIAAELLHGGQSFQVLGLTNHSRWPHAAALRRCAAEDAAVAAALGAAAERRLGGFAHVGTLEELPASVEAAAASLGLDLRRDAQLPPQRVRERGRERRWCVCVCVRGGGARFRALFFFSSRTSGRQESSKNH